MRLSCLCLLLVGCAAGSSVEPLQMPLAEQSCESLNREIEILDQRIDSLVAIHTTNAVANWAAIALPPLWLVTYSAEVLNAGKLDDAIGAMAAAGKVRESKGCVGPPPAPAQILNRKI